MNNLEKDYNHARERYLEIGIDTNHVIERIDNIPLSIHCWQGDDVQGFEKSSQPLTGGIRATGNYMGKPRDIDELRQDLEQSFEFIPGKKKLNLHAIYLDSTKKVARDEIDTVHFETWVEWALQNNLGLDFNPTCFSHPQSSEGFTLSHPDKSIRDFWIRHVKQSRKINEYFGRKLDQMAIMNIWIPDGYKDIPIDRLGPRRRLQESLDICLFEHKDEKYHIDAVESKLFGIGSESYVVGSHEFYLAYAIRKKIALCLDSGHFHPTEVVSNKLSAVALFLDHILLHVSRPVRWDSDHVVTLDDELLSLSQEIMRNKLEHKIHLGMDFFDASINRILAWIIGARNVKKSLLIAGLEPTTVMMDMERKFDFSQRLLYLEELKSYPWQAVWNYYCMQKDCGIGIDYYNKIKLYEEKVLINRK